MVPFTKETRRNPIATKIQSYTLEEVSTHGHTFNIFIANSILQTQGKLFFQVLLLVASQLSAGKVILKH